MLHKNEKSFSPKKGDFEKYTPHAIFRLANRLIKSNPNKKNSRKSVPRSFSIEPFFNATDPNSGEQVFIRYFKSQAARTVSAVSFVDYQPVELAFEHDAELKIMDNKELWWFLYNHPRQVSSPFRDHSKAAMFYLEDKAQEATDRAKISRRRAQAMQMIWTDLEENEVRDILKGYGQPKVDDLSEDQVRGFLEQRIKPTAGSNITKNLNDFLERAGGASMTIRAQIQDAIDLKIIIYNDKSKTWNHTKPDGTASGMICSSPNPLTRLEDLAVFLRERDKNNNLEYIISEIASKKSTSGGGSNGASTEEVLNCDEPGCSFSTLSKGALTNHQKKHQGSTENSPPPPASQS